VCEMTGKIKVKVDAKVPIQRTHIIKYIHDNMHNVCSLYRNFSINLYFDFTCHFTHYTFIT
jgi:hypothetical protein